MTKNFEGRHINFELNPIESAIRAEWRQWYGPEETSFTVLGTGYSEIDFKAPTDNQPDEVFRQFDVFGIWIVELDAQGIWRAFFSAAYNRTDIDITSFPPGLGIVKRHAKVDFLRTEARLTYEVVSDVDASIAVEYAVADQDDFNNISPVFRLAAFNRGPWRAELGARETFYCELDKSLATLFMDVNFAR